MGDGVKQVCEFKFSILQIVLKFNFAVKNLEVWKEEKKINKQTMCKLERKDYLLEKF
jgi:hypothetical protein